MDGPTVCFAPKSRRLPKTTSQHLVTLVDRAARVPLSVVVHDALLSDDQRRSDKKTHAFETLGESTILEVSG